MAQIGYVKLQADGSYFGHLRTLSIKAPIRISPNNGKKPDSNQPDFRVYADNVDIGAGWTRLGETSGREYVSLALAAPEFGPRRLYCNLGVAAGQDEPDVYALIWNPSD